MRSIDHEGSIEEYRGKTGNLRSKRAGRYVSLVDRSIPPTGLSTSDSTRLFDETLALVRRVEKAKKKNDQDRLNRRKAIREQERGSGGEKR